MILFQRFCCSFKHYTFTLLSSFFVYVSDTQDDFSIHQTPNIPWVKDVQLPRHDILCRKGQAVQVSVAAMWEFWFQHGLSYLWAMVLKLGYVQSFCIHRASMLTLCAIIVFEH